MKKLYSIHIEGLVEGVGFRPFIYRIATEMQLSGEVRNTNNGVFIRALLSNNEIDSFLSRIREECPKVAYIHKISIEESRKNISLDDTFRIVPSISHSDEITQVSPDIAVCDDCLRDRKIQPHRINYPFINCTHCGPRFSIIRDLPYDRAQTTMKVFPMCEKCKDEFTEVTDRRFHAQPIACNNCGPTYYSDIEGYREENYEKLLSIACRLIDNGKVIAVKGIGGYHLVCDATNEAAVQELRRLKQRDTKPFALMMKDISAIKAYTEMNEMEEEELLSWQRPIVLLKQKKSLPETINPGIHTLGCMLPYMPIHYDWFERIGTDTLVMTSGNSSDCSILIDPKVADDELKDKVPLILHHNRQIYNRVDDSVMQVCGHQPCLIRRSRGFVPEPFFTDIDTEGVLAFGAEKVNTFALGKGETIIQSQYIGDLKNYETFSFYTEALQRFQHLFRLKPKVLVCDLHPDYLSTQEAERISKELRLPLIKVQHHHAHAAACMMEYTIMEPVVALVLDGTGLGDDGKSWGGEVFYCDRVNYERLRHFDYVTMIGGDKAAKEPWRMALAYLWKYELADDEIMAEYEQRIGASKVCMLKAMMEKRVNCPETSSAGRLFDAISSLLGLCDVMTHQAQAAILLEQTADDDTNEHYEYVADNDKIIFASMIDAIIKDMKNNVPKGRIAARFHNTIVNMLFDEARILLKEKNASKVVISGGCFQNKRLTENLMQLFNNAGIKLYVPSRIPCNDGGISVGQLAIAAERMKRNLI